MLDAIVQRANENALFDCDRQTRRHSTSFDYSRHELTGRLAPARTAVFSTGTAESKMPANQTALELERAGFEPAPSGLQTQPIARPDLTPTDSIGMTEPKSAVPPNQARHRSTAVRSHRARTAAA